MLNPPLKSANSLIIMFISSLVLVGVFGAVLLQIGAPTQFSAQLFLIFAVGSYLFAGMFGVTTRLETFRNTGRTSNSLFAGLSIASALISSMVFVSFAGIYYQTGIDAFAILLGLILGLALMTVLFAAPLNRSGADTPTGFLYTKDKRGYAGITTLIVVVCCSLPLLILQFKVSGFVAETVFELSARNGMIISALIIAFCLICGGQQSLTVARVLAYPAILIAVFLPLAWTSYKVSGNPVAHLAFGQSAIQPVEQINREVLNSGFSSEADIFRLTSDAANLDTFNFVTTIICLALGAAAMPHLLQHFATLPKAIVARRAGFFSLCFLVLVITALPLVALFIQFDVYTTLLGLQLADMETDAGWVFGLSGAGNFPAIQICNAIVANGAEAVQACGQSDEYFLQAKDITVNPQYLHIGSALINDLPDLLTPLLAMGAMLALWSTADGLILVMANSVTGNLIKSKFANTGKQLFLSRLSIIGIIAISVLLSLLVELDTTFLFNAGFAVSAAAIFPVMLFRFLDTNANPVQLMVGLVCGLLITITLLFFTHYGIDLTPLSGDELKVQIPNLTNEVIGVGLALPGLIASVLVMLLTKFALNYQRKSQEEPTGEKIDASA